MVIHRRTLLDVPVRGYFFRAWKRLSIFSDIETMDCTVPGYLWGRLPRLTIPYNFSAVAPVHEDTIHPPYVHIEDAFFFSGGSDPEIFDTLICIAGHKLLVTAYLDNSLPPNPNLMRDFPTIPWRGEIAVLFIGKRKPYVTRAPPKLLIRCAVAQWVFIK